MKPVHVVGSLAGHAVLLLALGLVSLALSQPTPPPPDTIRISFGQLPPAAGGRRPSLDKPTDQPDIEPVSKPREPAKPKDIPKPKDDANPAKPARPKPAEPVKPLTRAQSQKAPAKAAPTVARPGASVPEADSTAQPAAAGDQTTDAGSGPLAQQIGAGGSVQARGDAGAGDSYLGLVQSKIGRRWQPNAASTAGRPLLQSTVGFRIGARGEVLEPTIVESSGLSVFDREALRAVVDSHPLPPPPARFRADGLNIQFTFTYRP